MTNEQIAPLEVILTRYEGNVQKDVCSNYRRTERIITVSKKPLLFCRPHKNVEAFNNAVGLPLDYKWEGSDSYPLLYLVGGDIPSPEFKEKIVPLIIDESPEFYAYPMAVFALKKDTGASYFYTKPCLARNTPLRTGKYLK